MLGLGLILSKEQPHWDLRSSCIPIPSMYFPLALGLEMIWTAIIKCMYLKISLTTIYAGYWQANQRWGGQQHGEENL